jgi:hypothetical protein
MNLSPALRDQIIDERMTVWSQRLRADHATPVACLGIGHDHTSGTLFVLQVEDMSLAELQRFLMGALYQVNQATSQGQR